MNNEAACIQMTKFEFSPYFSFTKSYQIVYISALLKSIFDEPK